MLIAQITDTHLGFEPGDPDEPNRRRLDAVLAMLAQGVNRPDLMIVSGDLVDRGDEESYQRCAEAFAACPFPVYPCLGNHDDRETFARVFPHVPMPSGFAHYCIALDGLRIILLDTLEPGRHGGGFCAVREAWLSERLAEQRDVPTIIVMHHPPFDAGIDWMSTRSDEPWVARFARAIAGHDQIRAIWCGHLHRAIVAPWQGVPVTVCPATSAQLALDLRPIDPAVMDCRPMVVGDPPGYALHRWQDGGLVTHFDTAQPRETLAKYDGKMQPLVRQLCAEQP
ncbi:phosphodiesterase [Sphingomonas sp. ERG5]|uniref:phosphodiesterase n=1 Tax=Sphingomonas sp. ERG5 TaxID=1381597 RepID=UPI00054B07BA|nr:phosphodiesterase [Sphingomonas sp. ERG5]